MMAVLDRLEKSTDRFSCFLESHQSAFLICFSLVYFPSSIWLASIKQFWSDELVTYYLSGLGTLSEIWAALRTTIDNQPPPFYLVTRAALRLGIDAQIASRLPEIVGFWLMTLLVFRYVTRRTGALYGAVAMMGPYLCNTYIYAYEARPYALVLGFCALALFCWQSAGDGRRRVPALCGLAFSMAAAVSSHYYAVLVVGVLAITEVVRSVCRKCIDWPMWLSIGSGASVAFLYLPFVLNTMGSFAGEHWATPGRHSVIEVYLALLGYSVLPLVALLAAVTVYLILESWSPGRKGPKSSERRIPPQEIAAGLALLLLPVIGYAVAVLATHLFVPRYFVAAVIGFSVLTAYAGFRATGGSTLLGTAWLAIAMVAFLVGGVLISAKVYRQRAATTYVLRTLLANQPGDLPVAMDDPLVASSLFYYERPDITSRLYYVVDPEASLRYGETPYPQCEKWLKRRDMFPVQAEELGVFRQTWRRFLLYSTGSGITYLLPKLLADGSEVRVVAAMGSHKLYMISEWSR